MIALPESLDFDDGYEATVLALNTLREAVESNQTVAELRFDDVRSMSPSAALVLASEVDIWHTRSKRRLKPRTERWDPKVTEILKQMGFFELLQITTPDNTPDSQLRYLKFARNRLPTPNPGEAARTLRVDIERLVSRQVKRPALYKGLSEAITNVGQHAYGRGSSESFYWISASYSKDTGLLSVSFFDRGRGIPENIKTHHLLERIRDQILHWPDSKRIQAAMELGRSSTGALERGKGLADLITYCEQEGGGTLSIFSSHGLVKTTVTCSPSNHCNKRTLSLRDRTHPIRGTLIEWTVTLRP